MSGRNCDRYKIAKCYRGLLHRAINLSEEDTGENQINRNLECLQEFLDNAHEYIMVQDLPHLIKLVYIVYQRCSQYEVYIPYLLKLLDICCFPPVLHKASDVLTYAHDIIHYLSMLGYIIVSSSNTEIRNCLFSGLRRLFSIKNIPINCVCQRVLNEMLANSQLPVLVGDVMYMADDHFYSSLLVLMSHLLDSDDTCVVFLEKKMIDLIFIRWIPGSAYTGTGIMESFKLPIHYKLTIQIVWRLCDAYLNIPQKTKDRLGVCVSKNGWEGARILYRHLVLAKGYKKERNILQKILGHISTAMPIELNMAFVTDLVIMSCVSEIGAVGTWASHVVLSNDEDDFDLKFMTMATHGFLRPFDKAPTLPSIYKTTKCMLAMLKLITLEDQLIWTHGQRLKLIMYGLMSTESILPFALNDFIGYGGPGRLVRLYVKIFDGQLPSDYLTQCLRCIHRSLVEGANTNIPNIYRSKGMGDLLFSYIKRNFTRSPLTMEDQWLLMTIFCILYHLNKNYKCLNDSVVPMCIDCVKRFQNPSDKDCFLDPRVKIAILDYIWEHITWSDRSRDLFVNQGGVYLLLDVLEQSPVAVKIIALNILVDLTDQGKTFPFMATWRGQNGISGVKLLLKIFRQSSFDNDNVTADGVIKDTEFPLMGKHQWRITFGQIDNLEGSPSCLDLLASTRPKIYALLTMIQCSPTKTLLRQHYQVYNTELSKSDKVAIVLAENFMILKIYELWAEMSIELRRSGRKIIFFDRLLIESHVMRAQRWAEFIQKVQLDVVDSVTSEELREEWNLYQNLRDQTLSDALSTLEEMILFADKMDREFRNNSKRKQTIQICNSTRPYINRRFNYHFTVLHDTTITKPFQQSVSIRSNVVIDPNKPEEPKPVSEKVSLENVHSVVQFPSGSKVDQIGTLSGIFPASDDLIS